MAESAPREIRSARRSASVALAVSSVMCLFSVAIFVSAQSEQMPADPLASSSVVRLDEEVEEPLGTQSLNLHGLFDEVRELQYGMKPTPYHLVTNSLLRAHASLGGEVVRAIPSGCQVFPLQRKGNWIQVVVPSHEVDGKEIEAAFGFLPAKEDGSELLEQDTELRTKRHHRRTGPPPSWEDVDAAWGQARAKNANLKVELAKLQASMHESLHHPTGQTVDQREKAKEQFREKMTEVIEVKELSKTVKQISNDLQEELKSPKQLISKIEDVFSA